MCRLGGVGHGVEGSSGLQTPVPHAAGGLRDGTVVEPEQIAAAVAVAAGELVVAPCVADTTVHHSAHELGALCIFVYVGGLAKLVGHILVEGGHLVEAVALHVVPHRAADGPPVLLGHHLLDALGCRETGGTILGVEAIHAAAALRGGILVVAHRVHSLIGAAVVHSVAFALHLVRQRSVQHIYQLRNALGVSRFIGAYVEGQARMDAGAAHGRCHVLQIYALVHGVLGVARHPEFLPHQDTQLVAQRVEIVALGDAAAPQTQQVDAGLRSVTQLGVDAGIIRTAHRLGNPVGPLYEDGTTVHIELLGFVGSVAVGLYLADTESDSRLIHPCAADHGAHFQVI